MKAVFERELQSFFNNLSGYFVCALMLLFAGIYTMILQLRNGYPNFEYVLSNMGFIFLIVIPVITMKTIADERKQKTDHLLYSLPLSMTEVVIAKYFALLVILAVPLLIMSAYPLLLCAFGKILLRVAYGNIIAFFFLGAALVAIGMFISSLTENQMIAASMSFLVFLLLYYMSILALYVPSTANASCIALAIVLAVICGIVLLISRNAVMAGSIALVSEGGLLLLFLTRPSVFEGLFPKIMDYLSAFKRFDTFTSGVFDTTALFYYLSISVFFVFLTIQSMEKRRWNG